MVESKVYLKNLGCRNSRQCTSRIQFGLFFVANAAVILMFTAVALHTKNFKCGWVWLLQLTQKVKGGI